MTRPGKDRRQELGAGAGAEKVLPSVWGLTIWAGLAGRARVSPLWWLWLVGPDGVIILRGMACGCLGRGRPKGGAGATGNQQ